MSLESGSSTAVTAKVCSISQLDGVKIREAGATRTSVPVGASANTVTLPIGLEASVTP